MEPKFQSSFIPKGPVSSSMPLKQTAKPAKKSIYGYLAMIIFALALLAGVGAFGYKFYLQSQIGKMGQELQAAQATLAQGETQEFIRLDNRIISTDRLINQHVTLSSVFDLLQDNTVQAVRFNDFAYANTKDGLELQMSGEARGYSAIALQSDLFNKNPYFNQPVFSNLRLDERGNVTFTFKTLVDPKLVSYLSRVELEGGVQINTDEEQINADDAQIETDEELVDQGFEEVEEN